MTCIYVRKATEKDLPAISDIINAGRGFLKEQGINQWQGAYPTNDDIKRDIDNGIAYVIDVNGDVAGSATLHLGIDPDYLKMEEGEWKNGSEAHYSAIHRVSVSHNYRGQGLAYKLISGMLTISALLGFKDVRIDTHPKNEGMQHIILNSGFTKRGVIQTKMEEDDRFAYQIELD
ncbi:GNAT family N-acetyltransferase [Fructilactobacillus ixorae]|uniref:GNAT family N-acetyltransferase n=2 Tax=Fructilactobacillus TaxID=2767881 RepID=A0ABY5BMX0_9LACO|nr:MULTISPECIES: GNAT family N-acetyltransferase [Fructilactobacillus]USS84580.1 GNAT family N-acetyltransferase [Fructilactobacillus myrtifloralis]USS93238.1 GNAT family N-acetyltransferase [Fructilactobacillus ixorae]